MSRMETTRTDRLKTALLLIAATGLIAGLAVHVSGRPDVASLVWIAGVVPALAALVVEIIRSLRSGEVGLDIVAALSMSAALVFGESLAAAVVAVMYSGGTFLEAFAEGRARRSMRDLLSRVPRTATRHRNGGLEEVPLDDIAPGDRLLIRQGDVVPVDGTVASETAFVDTSALTGESLPVRLAHGAEAMSGSTNAGEAFDLTATREARDSTYAGIVRLVEAAQASKAPMSRLADRWSLGFLAVTVGIAFAAWWFTGDPIRAVAVLVVATPCPLILAVPVALVAGLSRAAHFGVLIKGAGPLETMARIRTLILDKTGTLTDGRPQIVSIDSHDGMARTTSCVLPRPSTRPRSTPWRKPSSPPRRRGASRCPFPRTWRRSRARASWAMSRAGASSSVGMPLSPPASDGGRTISLPSLRVRSSSPSPSTGTWRGAWSCRTPCATARARCSTDCGDRASRASCWPPATAPMWPSA
jgi:cation transport ATPase